MKKLLASMIALMIGIVLLISCKKQPVSKILSREESSLIKEEPEQTMKSSEIKKEFPKIALYFGSGTIYDEDVKVALEKLNIGLERVNENDIKEGKLENFEAFIIPGGRTGVIVKALDKKGFGAIKNFVKEGGKYIGICAGAYLGPDFGIIDVENKRRSGVGLREIEISNSDHPIAEGYQGKIKIWYQNGPFMKAGKSVEVIAIYDEDFASIVCSFYGKGKVVLFSPHPEGNLKNKIDPQEIGTIDLLKNAIDW